MTSSTWECPYCNKSHDCDDYEDAWTHGGTDFQFECPCGAELKVYVEWEPFFHVSDQSKGPTK